MLLNNKYRVAIILQITFVTVFGVYPPHAMFYKEDRCFGQNYEYSFDTKVNLTESWSSPVSISFRGAWIMITHGIGNPETKFQTLITDGGGSLCLLDIISARTVISITKVLQTDLETSAIAFLPSYSGESDVSSTVQIYETTYQFAEPEIFEYVVITGVVDYTLYEGTNFDGRSLCVLADTYSDEYFGARNENLLLKDFKVGSLMRGKCSSNQDKAIESLEHLDSSSNFKVDNLIFVTESGLKVSVPKNHENGEFSVQDKLLRTS